ncbi:hypothetical protein H0H93_005788 [Arthromyces matolae]|nr:hypothetical protein H0H93_005788 [Arthromyces matolae]
MYSIPQLYRRIHAGIAQRQDDGGLSDASTLIYHLSVETWNADADVLTNLLRLLPNLTTLNVWIGPNNFSPEHLEEMFKPPMLKLNYLSLRFRPYVKKATYYQFLKGSYFDSTLLALSEWPPSPNGLPTVSIVQDAFNPDPNEQVPRFAQPIVFFRLDLYLSLLVHSAASHASLTSFRIRIPARPIIQPLTVAYLHPNAPSNPNVIPPPPTLNFLDIATCLVTENDIEKLLIHFTQLKHLVLDGCIHLLRGGSPQVLGSDLEWWSAFGRRLALVGVKRAKDREKQLKAWYEENYLRNPGDNIDVTEEIRVLEKRTKRGRRGLATATIKLRGTTNSPPRAGPDPGQSSRRSAGFSSASTSGAASSSTGSHNNSGLRDQKPVQLPKLHIVPPLPILKTIALFPTSTHNVPASIRPEVRVLIQAEFERGWNDGIRVLWEIRARMGTSFIRNLNPAVGKQAASTPSPRFFVFKEKSKSEKEEFDDREGHEGLEDVLPGEEDMFFRNENTLLDAEVGGPPSLCLAGFDAAATEHEPGCAHRIGQQAGLAHL